MVSGSDTSARKIMTSGARLSVTGERGKTRRTTGVGVRQEKNRPCGARPADLGQRARSKEGEMKYFFYFPN